MEEMIELLFELASRDRLALLLEVKAEKLRLTQLAQKLSATVQGTSRHLARLSDAKLVEKDSAGFWGLTAFGRPILNLLPSFRFLSENRDYFLSHDVSFLPSELIQRIGELSEHRHLERVSSILRHTEQVIGEAEKYVWLMSDQPLVPEALAGESLEQRKVSVRAMLPRDIDAEEYLYGISKARDRFEQEERFELRLVDDVRVAVAMNEKIAGVSFPDLGGRIDFGRGFRGRSSSFRKWCGDLFSFYWDKSEKSLPHRLQGSAI